MALTPSNMMELGTTSPNFTLTDVIRKKVRSLNELKGKKATLIMFICNHCPYVKHINAELARLGNDYKDKPLSIIAISSNDVINYPEDAPEKLAEQAKNNGFNFPYLYDESQEVAKAYDAACTPDFFLFDKDLSLMYRGQLDGSRPGNKIPVSGKDLREAVDAVLNDAPVSADQKPSIGCNIKWKN